MLTERQVVWQMMPIARLRRVARESPGAYLGRVFTEGHISDPVEAVFDGPVSVNPSFRRSADGYLPNDAAVVKLQPA